MNELPATIAESLPDEVLVIGKDYEIVWANRRAREAFAGRGVADPVGLKCHGAIHQQDSPCDASQIICPLSEALESGRSCCVTHSHGEREGRKIHMEIRVMPLPNDGGLLYMARDITERAHLTSLQEEMWVQIIEQMERIFADLANSQSNLDAYAKRLKESENRYRALYENASVGLYRTRISDGTILTVNDDFARLFGYDRAEEITGQSITQFYADPGKRHELLMTLKEQGEVRQYEVETIRRDGTPFSVYVSGRMYPETDCIEGAVFDITSRKQMEKALIQSEKLRALGEMASGVAHDFNNILSAIIGNAQMLETSAKHDPELRRRLHLIQVAAKDGAETIKRIQEFSRVRKDKNFSVIDLNNLVEEAILITSPRWKDQSQRLGKTINLKTHLSSVPALAGNASEMKEVVTNIIFNAIDAMPKGGEIDITTWHDSRYACLAVEDTGSGMPSHIRRRVFDPFFTTKGVTNAGLGLSVSYGIVRRHEGHIEVESKEGVGTKIVVRLPVNEKPPERVEEEEPQPKDYPRARILLVDDEEMVLETVSEVLASEGHEVVAAASGIDGLEKFREGAFDLVLTDLGMPEMSGWELAAAIKNISPDIPVAMITGWGAEFTREQLRERGVDLVLAKPFDCVQIARLVNQAMEIRRKALEKK
ncbi:MAG: response regulator [Pseudomonadota bacterium]